MQELQEQHEEHVKAIEDDQQAELERLKNAHLVEVEDLVYLHGRERLNFEENMKQMKDSFEKYQKSAQEEMERGWSKRETEMNRTMEQKIKEALERQSKHCHYTCIPALCYVRDLSVICDHEFILSFAVSLTSGMNPFLNNDKQCKI